MSNNNSAKHKTRLIGMKLLAAASLFCGLCSVLPLAFVFLQMRNGTYEGGAGAIFFGAGYLFFFILANFFAVITAYKSKKASAECRFSRKVALIGALIAWLAPIIAILVTLV